MTSFYVLAHTTLGPEVTGVTVKHIECSQCGLRPVARVGGTTVRFTRKSDLTDWSRTAEGLIVRPSVIDHLTEARLSGWRQGIVHVNAVSRLREQNLDYDELIVVGHTRGYASLVELEIRDECSECGRKAYRRPENGLVLPQECWDGSDILTIDELPGITIVTEAFRQVVASHRHTGIELVPIEEWRDPLYRHR